MRNSDLEEIYSGSSKHQLKNENLNPSSRFSDNHNYWRQNDTGNDREAIAKLDPKEALTAKNNDLRLKLTKTSTENSAFKDESKSAVKRSPKKKPGTMFINELWSEAYSKQIAEQNEPIETRRPPETDRVRESVDQDSSQKFKFKRFPKEGSESSLIRKKPMTLGVLQIETEFPKSKGNTLKNIPEPILKNLTISTPRLPNYMLDKVNKTPKQPNQDPGSLPFNPLKSRLTLPNIKTNYEFESETRKMQDQIPKRVIFESSSRSIVSLTNPQKTSALLKRGEYLQSHQKNRNTEDGSQNEVLVKFFAHDEDPELSINLGDSDISKQIPSEFKQDLKSHVKAGEGGPRKKKAKQEKMIFRKAFEDFLDTCTKERKEIAQSKKRTHHVNTKWPGKNSDTSRFEQVKEVLIKNEVIECCKAVIKFKRQQAYIK